MRRGTPSAVALVWKKVLNNWKSYYIVFYCRWVGFSWSWSCCSFWRPAHPPWIGSTFWFCFLLRPAFRWRTWCSLFRSWICISGFPRILFAPVWCCWAWFIFPGIWTGLKSGCCCWLPIWCSMRSSAPLCSWFISEEKRRKRRIKPILPYTNKRGDSAVFLLQNRRSSGAGTGFPALFLPFASVEQGEVSFILLRTVRQISRNFSKELKEYLQTKEKSRWLYCFSMIK